MQDTNEKRADVLIIGGGPAGASAAIYAARGGHKVVVLDKNERAGALGITHLIANYPGVQGEISGADLLARMRGQAESFGAEFIQTKVNGMFLDGEDKQVFTTDGDTWHARAVILATGGMGKSKTIPGESELLGRGVSYCATCDAAFYKGRTAAVVGASEEAIEEALVLARFAEKVYLLNPKPKLDVSEELIERVIAQENLELQNGAKVRAVLGEGKVESVEFSGKEPNLEVDGVFLYLTGTKPIVDYAAGALDMEEGSCLVVDRDFQTSQPGVFAVGDILCRVIKQAVVAASEGTIAALGADRYLTGAKNVRKDYA